VLVNAREITTRRRGMFFIPYFLSAPFRREIGVDVSAHNAYDETYNSSE
jgi:hypothetical protein